MKALLYKDFMTSKRTYLIAVALLIVLGIVGIVNHFVIIIPLMFSFMSIILNSISFGNEKQSEFPKFVFTSPISRNSYVRSKYVLSVISGIVAFILSLIIVYIEYDNIGLSLVIASATLLIPILFTAIQVPFFLKFGEEKGRILMVLIYFALPLATSLLKGKLGDLMDKILNLSQSVPYIIFGVVLLITIAILVISQFIGIKIAKKLEY